MKQIFLLICVFFAISGSAQDSVKIVGNWEPVIISDGKLYYNFENDSLRYIRGYEQVGITKQQIDSVERVAKQVMKELSGTFSFRFFANKTYKNEPSIWPVVGTYQVNEKAKIISLLEDQTTKEKSEGITPHWSRMKYFFIGERLTIVFQDLVDTSNFSTELIDGGNSNLPNDDIITVTFKKVK